ncbi:hypothetical protein [Thalassobacillus devorans]|uniref:hypothetical protein n=1 Tax=Thalassobacillus devorans TaxID=279813 RepID=UPI000A1C9AB0|nr:hypothetical protein [Thalassobacillus devorans]
MGAIETLMLFYPTIFLLLGIIFGIGYKLSKCRLCLIGLFGYLLANAAFFFFRKGGFAGLEQGATGAGFGVFADLTFVEVVSLLFVPSGYSFVYTGLLLLGYLFTAITLAVSRKNAEA